MVLTLENSTVSGFNHAKVIRRILAHCLPVPVAGQRWVNEANFRRLTKKKYPNPGRLTEIKIMTSTKTWHGALLKVLRGTPLVIVCNKGVFELREGKP